MQMHLTTGDGVPIYQQIVNQVKYAVAAKRLAAGEELPAIRVLAEQLVVNPNTVARAYLELERAGVVVKKHGSGTFVSDAGSPLARKERIRILTRRVDGLLAEARQMDIGLEDLIQMLRARQAVIEPSTPDPL